MGRLTKNQEKILGYLREMESAATTEQVAKALDIAWQTAQLNLLTLAQQNRIKFEKIGRQNLFMKRGTKLGPEEEYKKLFEESPQATWIFDRETLQFLAVNARATQVLGYSREELSQLRLIDILDREEDRELLQMRVLRKRGFNDLDSEFRTLGIWRVRTKSGQVLLVEVNARPLLFQKHLANIAIMQPVSSHQGAKLRDEEARYPLAAVLPSIIWTARPEGIIEFANQLWYDYTGFSYADTKNIRWELLVHGEDLHLWEEAWTTAVSKVRTREIEVRLLRSDGTYLWHIVRIVPIKDEKGRVTIIAGSMFDTHKFHQAEHARRIAEERFNRLLDSVKEYAIFMLDADGVVTTWNKGAQRLKGWAAHEIIGKPYTIFFSPEEQDRAQKILQRAKERGSYHEEGWRMRKDGSRFLADFVVTALKDDNGALIGFAKFTRDITQLEQSEEIVKRLNQRNQLVLDNVQEGIYGIDDKGTVSFMNPAAERMLGWSFEEVQGRIMHDLIHHTKADGAPLPVDECLIYRALDRKESFVGEEIIWRKDGTSFDAEFISTPIVERGDIKGAVIVMRDVTERKKADEALRNSREQLRVILAGIKDGITAVTPSGEFVYANDSAAKILGLNSAEEIMSMRSSEVMSRFEIVTDAGEAIDISDLPTRKAFKGEVVTDVLMKFRIKETNEEHWSRVSAKPVFDDHHKVAFVINIFRDITAEKKTQEDVREKEKRLRFLAEASAELSSSIEYEQTLKNVVTRMVPDLADWCAIDMLDEDGNLDRLAVVHIDPEKINLAYAVHEEIPFNADAAAGLAHVLRTGKPEFTPLITQEMIDAVHLTPKQRALVDELQLNSIIIVPLIVRGKTLGALTLVMAESKRQYTEKDVEFAQDIARRAAMAVDNARLYQDSQQALALRDDFLSIASHELKTPVTSVKAFLQALEQRMAKPEQFDFKKNKEYMQLSIKQVDRLGAIINDLLDITRINKGRMEYNFKTTSIGPVVAEVVERMSVSFPSHIIACKLQDLTVKARLDMLRFEQVMTNLLTNAVKYSPPGSVIDVTTYSEDGKIFIAIKDQGIGISEEEQKLIFNRYYRTHDAISSKVGGMGIGLYISLQLIEAHGGTLSVESRPGKGSTFIITLPQAGGK